MKKISLYLVFLFLTIAILTTGCNKTETVSDFTNTNKIAYIYNGDNTDGVAFKTLLQANDWEVTLIEKATVTQTNYTSYKLIVIDPNTDVIGGGAWTNADTIALKGSGKPMLLMGMGGLLFATQSGNVANWLTAGQFNERSFYAADKNSILYQKPYVISIQAAMPVVTLYDSSVAGVGQYTGSGVVKNNVLVGNFFGATRYYPLTIEDNRYATFGFFKGVQYMNQTGRELMVNLCYYVSHLN